MNETNGSTLLSVRNITKAYQGVTALDSFSLEVPKGGLLGLVGKNGAGKSTLISIISGAIVPDSGSFIFDGKEYSSLTPAEAQRMGIRVVHQEVCLAPDLSAAENIFMGALPGKGLFFDKKEMEARAGELLARLNTNIDPRIAVSELSTAEARMLEIAKAASGKASLLILDEPTAELTPSETEKLFAVMEKLRGEGVTMIYISHRLGEVLRVCDSITVMRDGRTVADLPADEADESRLISLMAGRQLSEVYPSRATEPGKTVLRAMNLRGNGVRDVSLELREGEILGIAGLAGSGRTETARLLFGASENYGGGVSIDNGPQRAMSPERSVELGIGYVPEDRKSQGVLMDMSVGENISLPILRRLSGLLFLKKSEERTTAGKYSDMLQIKTPSIHQTVKNLSGGNQQKVALGKWLASSSRILIFDEPTRGVDVEAKHEIYEAMNRLSERGVAIIMISSEMEELMGMADRIMVLHEGSVAGEIPRPQFDRERIMEMASGMAAEKAAS